MLHNLEELFDDVDDRDVRKSKQLTLGRMMQVLSLSIHKLTLDASARTFCIQPFMSNITLSIWGELYCRLGHQWEYTHPIPHHDEGIPPGHVCRELLGKANVVVGLVSVLQQCYYVAKKRPAWRTTQNARCKSPISDSSCRLWQVFRPVEGLREACPTSPSEDEGFQPQCQSQCLSM